MNAWMNSEGHRANILNPNFKKLGVGYRTVVRERRTGRSCLLIRKE